MSSAWCTFWLDDLLFGIEVLGVQEILRAYPVTPVPLATGVVHGLINLRGQIVTAIDMRQRLEMPARTSTEAGMQIVLRSPADLRCLVVDRVGDVVLVDEAGLQRPPQTVAGPARDLAIGAWPMEGRLLLLLNLDKTAFFL